MRSRARRPGLARPLVVVNRASLAFASVVCPTSSDALMTRMARLTRRGGRRSFERARVGPFMPLYPRSVSCSMGQHLPPIQLVVAVSHLPTVAAANASTSELSIKGDKEGKGRRHAGLNAKWSYNKRSRESNTKRGTLRTSCASTRQQRRAQREQRRRAWSRPRAPRPSTAAR